MSVRKGGFCAFRIRDDFDSDSQSHVHAVCVLHAREEHDQEAGGSWECVWCARHSVDVSFLHGSCQPGTTWSRTRLSGLWRQELSVSPTALFVSLPTAEP